MTVAIVPTKSRTESDSDERREAAEHHQKLKLALEHSWRKLRSGGDPTDIIVKLKSILDPLILAAEPQNYATMTSAELDSAELNTTYLVEDVIAAGQPCVVAASKKSLKTTTAIDLTLSLASGAKFLNRFYVPRSVRVAMMSGESGEAVIQETARRIAKTKPWYNLSDYENAIWSFELPKIGQPQTKRDLTKFISDHAMDVLIIDPAYLCMDLGDNASNLFAVGKQLIELTEVMHETGCTIIIVHHLKKSIQNPFAAPELEDIAWAGFQEWARQWILLGRRETYDPENAGSHKLWLSVGGSAGHSGLWAVDVEEGSRKDPGGRRWSLSIQNASAAIAQAVEERKETNASRKEKDFEEQIEKGAAKLLEVYKRYPCGETGSVIRGIAGMSGTVFPGANDRLLKDGWLITCEVTKSGRKHPGYRLKEITRTTRTASGQHSDNPTESESQTLLGQPPPIRGLSENVCVSDSHEIEKDKSGHDDGQFDRLDIQDCLEVNDEVPF